MSRILFALLLVFCVAFEITAQTVSDDVFSGTVTASTAEAVTVVRKVPAKPDESRVFVVDKETKIEGRVRVSAHVSVRFKANDDGTAHALRIIVRTDDKAMGGGSKSASPGRR